jgi:hypothetical protein
MVKKENNNIEHDAKILRVLWIGIFTLCILAPLGLLASGTAWGEWGSEQLRSMLGYIPDGLEKLEQLWNALLADYEYPGSQGPAGATLGYIASALIGVVLVALITFLLGKLISSKNGTNNT